MATSDASDTHKSSDQLGHVSLNVSAAETIVFLHGMGMSHREWELVWPHLIDTYHILAVDLPLHASSSHISQATIPAQADAVADLIRTHARGGTAHVVGMSMGGFVAVELARRHPSLIQSAFATGSAPFRGLRLFASRNASWLQTIETVQQRLLPRWFRDKVFRATCSAQGLSISDELAADMRSNEAARLTAPIFTGIGAVTMEDMKEVRVRTLAVAGGKMDDVEATRMQGVALRSGCSESRAAVVKAAWHGWDLQLPELFAQGVKMWVEGRELPAEFETLH